MTQERYEKLIKLLKEKLNDKRDLMNFAKKKNLKEDELLYKAEAWELDYIIELLTNEEYFNKMYNIYFKEKKL